MAMLVHADDTGTTLVLPQIDPTRPERVRAARYINGKRVEDLIVPVEDWRDREQSMLDDGFYESDTIAEIRIEIDPVTRQIFIAGGEPIDLRDADPDAEHPESLVEIADEYLDARGFFRCTDWWHTPYGPLTAVGSPEAEHGYDPHERNVAGMYLDTAATRLRQTVRAAVEPSEPSARLQVVLYGDPTANGFRRRLEAAAEGAWLSPRLAAGVRRLLDALDALRRNDGDGAAGIAKQIISDFPCPLHAYGPGQIEWVPVHEAPPEQLG